MVTMLRACRQKMHLPLKFDGAACFWMTRIICSSSVLCICWPHCLWPPQQHRSVQSTVLIRPLRTCSTPPTPPFFSLWKNIVLSVLCYASLWFISNFFSLLVARTSFHCISQRRKTRQVASINHKKKRAAVTGDTLHEYCTQEAAFNTQLQGTEKRTSTYWLHSICCPRVHRCLRQYPRSLEQLYHQRPREKIPLAIPTISA